MPVLRDGCAILLHGGRVLLLFVCRRAPAGRPAIWSRATACRAGLAECWQREAGGEPRWYGVAVLDDAAGGRCGGPRRSRGNRWRLAAAPRLDVAPGAAGRARPQGRGQRPRGLRLPDQAPARRVARPTRAEAQSHRAFARAFIAAAAGRDGFIEIVGAPDTGGFFAQGWSMSLHAGHHDPRRRLRGPGAARGRGGASSSATTSCRPGHGFCFFGKFWSDASLARSTPVFFERDGQLLRLDVVRERRCACRGGAARASTSRTCCRGSRAPDETMLGVPARLPPALRRRRHALAAPAPRSPPPATPCLQAPDGTLLVLGWLLDPLRRVERVLIKSTANLYGQLDAGWCALPRPDLTAGFAQDPRFANLLDERDVMHGFIAHAPAGREQTEGAEVYLELVLDDGSCLFRPLDRDAVRQRRAAAAAAAAASAPAEPELARIIDDPPRAVPCQRPAGRRASAGAARAIRRDPARRRRRRASVAAVMPFRSYAELQPLLALLAGTPEAEALDLRPRDLARRCVGGARRSSATPSPSTACSGGLVRRQRRREPWPRSSTSGVEASSRRPRARAGRPPRCRRRRAGWRACSTRQRALPVPGLLSPALTYEDGSIYFGGATGQPGATGCPRRRPMPVAAGAAEIALIDRAALQRVGGFSATSSATPMPMPTLPSACAAQGLATWCSGAVEFWMLDDPAPDPGPLRRMLRQVDARPARAARPDRREGARGMKALVVSHAHPTFSIGGAQVASYNLFQGDEVAGGLGRPLPRRGRPAGRAPPRHPADVARPGPGRDAVLVRRLRLVLPRHQRASTA